MKYLAFLFLLQFSILQAQTDTIFNQKDKSGRKQGFWKAKYPNGNIKYTAFFKNDKPVGRMKRYFQDKVLMAEMVFDTSGTKSRVKMYFEQGPLAATGNFINSQKDSVWSYFSYYTKTLSKQEVYKNGKLNGISRNYFASGKIAEERDWSNNAPLSYWKRFYENGVVRMSIVFSNGKRNGKFELLYPNGNAEWIGAYLNDLPEGKWVNYDPNKKEVKTVEYKNGTPVNAEELSAEEKKFFDMIDQMKGKIPEPDENNFWDKTR
jgi:antitoxin component YwqK of YwqJK toxin-antitoxin module